MAALKARLDNPQPAPRPSLPHVGRGWVWRIGKRSVNGNATTAKIGREKLRVHDFRHTYASLSRRAGADLRLLQKAMGHASSTVTAHTHADLFDDELDNIAAALDSLDDLSLDPLMS